jgi:peptidyl-prolyl cis-trans isomerase D
MLTTLRNSSKNSILKIIFGTLLTVLIISFGMWGTEDLVGVSQKQSSVATVGKIDISSREFYSLYSRQTEEIRKLLGSSLDIKKSREFGYVDRALSSLINRALFNNEASELGLSVSDINVRDKILKDDAFKDDLGQFSELVFRQLISESGYTEDSYVEGSRQDLAREQMVETISSSLIIPKIMKNKLSEYSLEERSVDYITLKVEDEILSNPEESEIKEFYQENKENFMSNEYRSSETLLLDAKEYAKKSTVTEEEVKLLYEERKDLLVEPAQRFLHQIIVDSEQEASSIHKKVNFKNFSSIAKIDAGLSEDDINLGWNTKKELPDEIIEATFKLDKGEVSNPIQSSFGWHIIKVIDVKSRKEIKYNEIKENFKSEILLEKGKEAVFDLQDELEDLLASGNNFEEISKLLEVKMIVASDIDNTGRAIDGNQNKEFKDERILRTIFNQKLNEEGNIIDIDKDEGLAISIVTKITPPRQLSLEEARKDVVEKLVFDLKLQKALKKAEMIKNKVANGDKFEVLAKSYNLNIKGVKPFTRILPDSSDLPIPLISKIFDSKIGEVNFEKRGGNEIVVVRTAEILNTLSENQTEKTEFSKKIRDDLTIDLLAQFSEALRKKYKITINDDVIDQLN